ncbi:MAG: ABC transporter permease [Bacteroidota bacterium]
MLKNYILVAWRSLLKKFGFTIINVLGLAFGMATCLLISLYVSYDLSYDDFQDDNVYRMWINRVYPEREVNYPIVPHSFGPQMLQDFPEVIAQGRCFYLPNPVAVKIDEDTYLEEHFVFADTTFLQVVNIPFLHGDPETALTEPNSVIISAATARKLYGEVNAVGKQLEFFNQSRKVSAVAADYPNNSHFRFDYIVPGFLGDRVNFVGFNAMTYIRLREGTDPATVESKLPAFVKQYAEGPIQKRNGMSYDEYVAAGNGYNYYLTHIKDIHLYSHLENEIKANGNINYIYIFSIIAIFILVIACINFTNLSTARSTERGREVGIRKVLGSSKHQLIGQFLAESILVAIFGALIALVITYLALPYFNDLAARPLTLWQLARPGAIATMLLVTLAVGLFAGIYPAFFISSFSALSVMKGRLKGSKTGIYLRNGLVILQFAISITLISATLIVFEQMSYMLNKPLGFDQENVIVMENAGALNDGANGLTRLETFKSEINDLPEVKISAYTSNMPGDLTPDLSIRVPGTAQKELIIRTMRFDDELPEVLGIEVLEGRFFSRDFEDSLSMVLNAAAVEQLEIADPIGKKILQIAANADPIEYTIIGVIDDFHFQSLHVDLKPACFTSIGGPNGNVNKMAISVSGNEPQRTMRQIEDKWNKFVSYTPFKSYFLASDMQEFYENEKATGRILGIFTILAIMIACIGLLGLSSFVINQRVKEIGVRKVLGATIPQLILLLSVDFTKLIAIAIAIAIPTAYFWMNQWLDNFAYAIGIGALVFVLSGTMSLLVGIGTISFQAIKAALANPVESLRDE